MQAKFPWKSRRSAGRVSRHTDRVAAWSGSSRTLPELSRELVRLGASGTGTLSGVNDADQTPPIALTATLETLTIKVDRPQLSDADNARLGAAMKPTSLSGLAPGDDGPRMKMRSTIGALGVTVAVAGVLARDPCTRSGQRDGPGLRRN